MLQKPPKTLTFLGRGVKRQSRFAISLSMIKTISISLGLVGLTAFGGMALSMAHDLSFAAPQRVAPEQLQQVALAQPAPSAVPGQEVVTGNTTLRAMPGEAQVIHAILESSGPHNRAAGKSMATASAFAPARSIAPQGRFSVGQDYEGQGTFSGPRDDGVSVSGPSIGRSSGLTYVSATQRPAIAAPSRPAPVVARTTQPAPEPGYLIGVFR